MTLFAVLIGCIAINFTDAAEVSQCYQVNMKIYCFRTNGLISNYSKAREFCESVNSTLPIITDENTDNVFQQFRLNDSLNMIRDKYVWLDARANLVEEDDPWQWIDGQPSGLITQPTNQHTHTQRERERETDSGKMHWLLPYFQCCLFVYLSTDRLSNDYVGNSYFHQILHAARKCGRFDAYCLCGKLEIEIGF